jgi:hypothetical protein
VSRSALRDEIPLIIDQIELFTIQLATLKARMIATLDDTPEAAFLLTIHGVQPVTAATFLGSIGDPRAYESSAQVLKLAGLSLVERSGYANPAGRCHAPYTLIDNCFIPVPTLACHTGHEARCSTTVGQSGTDRHVETGAPAGGSQSRDSRAQCSTRPAAT